MVDQDLRGLERAAAAGDAQTCIAWARALERLGRPDEAIGAYLAALDRDPATREARERLAATPAWSGTQGDAGRTGTLDVEALRDAPARLWHVSPREPAEPRLRRFSEPYLLGGWTAAIALHPAPARVEAYDVRDGRLLWVAPGWADRTSSYVRGGDVVLRGSGRTTVHDLRTGEERLDMPVGAVSGTSGWAPGLDLRASTPANLWRLDALDWPDPRVAPAASTPRWTLVRPRDQRGRTLVSAGPLVVIAFIGGEVAALDALTGDERWRRTGAGLHADPQGVAIRRHDVYTLLDLEGRGLWTHPAHEMLALGRDHVVMAPASLGLGPELRLQVLERRTGAVVAELVTAGPVLACALVREVLYVAGMNGLDAFSIHGARLWRLGLDDLPGRVPVALLPLQRRLLVGMQSGDLVLLADAGPGADEAG